ncbi:MAG TPA: lamin tail domain-containing protein [Lacipirellulaceae bacterium]|nr:lamin tail domain-containing protein [Lacipirellulaceae bacterium]
MRLLICCAAFCAILSSWNAAHAAVIINEFVYDDGGTDDREYLELYNNGASAVDISGWVVRNSDTVAPPGDNNADFTIPANTSLAGGDYYVIGMTGVANVDLVVTGTLENDNEAMELLDASGAVQDTVIYELNKGPLPASPAEGGVWGNNQSSDLTGTPLVSTAGLARFVDGRDTNNNGRDFGFRPNTPGASNNPVNITSYTVPDVSSTAVGADLPGFAYSFVPPRAIDPAVADTNNPNVIPPAPSSPNRAIIAWDPSGGGNAVSAAETFNTADSSFDIYAYFDTRDLPQMVNSAVPPVQFRGSEISVYGIGGTEALSNLTDISGQVGVPDSANGTTGVAWVYEKVGETTANPGVVSEKLYLVDANDGGDSGQGGTVMFDWTILATVDLSATPSGWYRLGIDIDALGNGVARFDNQLFNFTTSQHSGAFSVAYRENTQLGADGTPDAILRPPTFAAIPEPGSLMLMAVGMMILAARRRY